MFIFIFGFHISNASKQLSTFAPHECYKYVTLLYEQIQIMCVCACVCAWIQFSNALEFQPPPNKVAATGLSPSHIYVCIETGDTDRQSGGKARGCERMREVAEENGKHREKVEN